MKKNSISKIKKTNTSWSSIMGLVTWLTMACSSNSGVDATRLDGGASPATFAIKLTSGSSASTLAKTAKSIPASGKLTVTEAKLSVDEIKIKFPDGVTCADAGFVTSSSAKCEEENETEDGKTFIETHVKIKGPIIFDLVAGTSEPSLEALQLPSGVYRKIKLKLKKSDALSGHTLIVKGAYADAAGAVKKLELKLDDTEVVQIKNPSGFRVIEGFQNALTTTLNVASWLEGVKLDECITQSNVNVVDDVILIDDDSDKNECEDLDDLFKDNVKGSMECKNENDDSGKGEDKSDDNSKDESSGDKSKS